MHVNAVIGERYFSVSSDFEDVSLNVSFQDGLVDWLNEYSIKQNTVDGLLALLKDNGHPNLPSCACTLLHTSRCIPIQKKSDMDYVSFSFGEQLLKHFHKHPCETVKNNNHLEASFV